MNTKIQNNGLKEVIEGGTTDVFKETLKTCFALI